MGLHPSADQVMNHPHSLKRPLTVIAVGLVLFAGLLAWSSRGGAFGRYVLSPVPASVRAVRVDSNDWPLNLNPEPVVHLGFQASANDLALIVTTKGMVLAPGEGEKEWLIGRGPAWWTPPLREPGTRLFRRHGRRGVEFLVIDPAGTNAWFMLWGI